MRGDSPLSIPSRVSGERKPSRRAADPPNRSLLLPDAQLKCLVLARNRFTHVGLRAFKRRGRDLNSRRTPEPETVFETAA